MEYFLPSFLQKQYPEEEEERLSMTDSFYDEASKLLHTQAAGHNPLLSTASPTITLIPSDSRNLLRPISSSAAVSGTPPFPTMGLARVRIWPL